MLILSRKPGESVMLDGDIRVVVVRVKGNRVTLGIEAPPDIAVWRTEGGPIDRRGDRDSQETAKERSHVGINLRP